jgi:molybdenum-dependent DNA-binding transcriptional regulator ModE
MKLEARLRAFAAFARQRSFSAAATELHISQPAISKHIAELEHALGLKLVERARRGCPSDGSRARRKIFSRISNVTEKSILRHRSAFRPTRDF